jgi:hypothetical protein
VREKSRFPTCTFKVLFFIKSQEIAAIAELDREIRIHTTARNRNDGREILCAIGEKPEAQLCFVECCEGCHEAPSNVRATPVQWLSRVEKNGDAVGREDAAWPSSPVTAFGA